MKILLSALLAVATLAGGQGILRADSGYSFNFTAQQKKGDGTKKDNGYETVKNQKYSYLVTIENKSFKDASNVEIKYVVFSNPDTTVKVTVNGHQELQRHAGQTTIPVIKNNDKATFNTDGVTLQSVELSDGYYWDSGETVAKGALKGLWVRVYVGGQMVAEYMNPTDLPNKATFDPPPKKKK